MDSTLTVNILYNISAMLEYVDSRISASSIIMTVFVLLVSYCSYKIVCPVYKLFTGVYMYKADAPHLRARPNNKMMYGRVKRKNGTVPEPDPPMVPNGWYYIMCSYQLLRGEVKHVNMCGLELAVFRDSNGEVHALDAFCPHLGANMAVGGKVEGDCLECPFHAWKFDGDGKCVDIPGAKRVPDVAKTKSWPVLERNLVILLWFDAEERDPLYLPREIEMIEEKNWVIHGISEHIVHCHISEIPENGADFAHFDSVHLVNAVLGSDPEKVKHANTSLSQHMWSDASWEASKEHWYKATGHVLHDLSVLGYKIPFLQVKTMFEQTGPGVVYLEAFKDYGSMVMMMLVVPLDTFKQRVMHVTMSDNTMFGKFKAMITLYMDSTMVERDIVIWNNKRFTKHSVFASTTADEYLVKFRRWYSQFYSESSHAKSQELRADLTW